jgi:hypothetical protein
MKIKGMFFVLCMVFSAGAFAGGGHHHHHHHDQGGWDAFLNGLGNGLANPYSRGYYYPPPRYYYTPPPPARYYAPRRPYCYSVDIGGYYDYYGRYSPIIQQRCEYR